MTRRELVNGTVVVRSRGPRGWWVELIDPAIPGLVVRVVLAVRGSRSPPG
jgi:hypothetical protein